MSTIAARAHSSASLSAPVRRAAPQPRRKTTWLGRVGRMAAHRPGRAFVLLVFAGVSAAILANALMLQKARHPAPMISAPSQSPSARQAVRSEQPAAVPNAAPAAAANAAPAPLPPSRPNDLPQQARETASREAVIRPPAGVTNVPRSAAAPAPAPAPAARAAAPRDPIADLINGADIRPPAEIRGVAQAKPATPRRSAEN
ncbi:MAG TPA: hypothetical protein VGN82_19105 [Bosea sp. (in: a-proteobacteria)]|jgi:cytoskeletal protein RodZ|uniref:hypothetical protein n=1 Tax=Bosea sp. (in: a-proteobacteria) TaxID=1871050 RepID=UPI002E0D77B3|nr:hypothetical protein [Bosea sp. (in: a-proteobacteria)]